ncbi:hypothetical protein HQ590_12610 [bacterium]|nr:hypothetical protein [bacterium]
MIRIDYGAAEKGGKELPIPDELVNKAQGWFSAGARKELRSLFDTTIRVLASEVGGRQQQAQQLFPAGEEGLWEAVKVYKVGGGQSFRQFATPIIRQYMQRARAKLG